MVDPFFNPRLSGLLIRIVTGPCHIDQGSCSLILQTSFYFSNLCLRICGTNRDEMIYVLKQLI